MNIHEYAHNTVPGAKTGGPMDVQTETQTNAPITSKPSDKFQIGTDHTGD